MNAPTQKMQEMKACKFCGEEILAIAKKCKHCGSMLDGSAPASTGVVIKGADPFAEYHTPIQGKKEGKITFIGWCGMGIGVLTALVSCSEIKGDGFGNLLGALIGAGFFFASYLWARKK